jgi:hypothetical protein
MRKCILKISKADLYSSVPLDEISDSRIREAIEMLNALPEKEHLKAAAALIYLIIYTLLY